MKVFTLIAGPLAGTILAASLVSTGTTAVVAIAAGVTLLCAIWWIFEPVPIPATSLIPLAVFPLTGVLSPNDVALAYGNPLILLLMGGFMLSMAMERSGAHRRIALYMVNLFGGGGTRSLVFGFMAAAAVLSMWISNTATVLMMLPIALAVLDKSRDPRLTISLLLGMAYAASVGGIGTPIGTPPNLIFMQVYGEATGLEPGFTDWMGWGIPVVVLLVPVIAVWITRGLDRSEVIDLPDAGAWRVEEKRTLAVFAATAFAWITRKEPYGGWSGLFGLENANDASVALLAVVAMFLIPNGRGEKLLDWPTAARIPWGVLILFGAGITIARAFSATGISGTIGEQLSALQYLPPVLVIGIICLSVTFLTEVTSNTATTALLMPILAAGAMSAGIDPKILMVPAAMTASCAFMLPVATAPNAVVFGSGRVTIARMVREGFVLNLLGVTIVTLVSYWLLI